MKNLEATGVRIVLIDELHGPALDWAVAKYADLERPGLANLILRTKGKCLYKPSSNRDNAYDIIFKNRIALIPSDNTTLWKAKCEDLFVEYVSFHAEPFVAAMRSFLKMKTKRGEILVPFILLEIDYVP